LGYAEVIAYLRGEMSLSDAIARMKQKTRQFAKRQLTWFRAMKDAKWLSVENKTPSDVAHEIAADLKWDVPN
jgi:tRNA dimethylallyltransferase